VSARGRHRGTRPAVPCESLSSAPRRERQAVAMTPGWWCSHGHGHGREGGGVEEARRGDAAGAGTQCSYSALAPHRLQQGKAWPNHGVGMGARSHTIPRQHTPSGKATGSCQRNGASSAQGKSAGNEIVATSKPLEEAQHVLCLTNHK